MLLVNATQFVNIWIDPDKREKVFRRSGTGTCHLVKKFFRWNNGVGPAPPIIGKRTNSQRYTPWHQIVMSSKRHTSGMGGGSFTADCSRRWPRFSFLGAWKYLCHGSLSSRLYLQYWFTNIVSEGERCHGVSSWRVTVVSLSVWSVLCYGRVTRRKDN